MKVNAGIGFTSGRGVIVTRRTRNESRLVSLIKELPIGKETMSRVNPITRIRAQLMRAHLTPQEQTLWTCLSRRQMDGLKFRRQHPIGNYILDFYCPQIKLAVEVDGDSHAEREEYDLERSTWLEARGCTVIRFSNRQVRNELPAVLETILDVCRQLRDKLD